MNSSDYSWLALFDSTSSVCQTRFNFINTQQLNISLNVSDFSRDPAFKARLKTRLMLCSVNLDSTWLLNCGFDEVRKHESARINMSRQVKTNAYVVIGTVSRLSWCQRYAQNPRACSACCALSTVHPICSMRGKSACGKISTIPEMCLEPVL